MEKNQAYEHMTESDKMIYDLLFEKLGKMYEENHVTLLRINEKFTHYFSTLVDVPDTLEINVNFNGYSTTICIREKGSKGWGRDLNIYTKENHDYINNKVTVEGIEVSMSSNRFSSKEFDPVTYLYLMLSAEIAKNIAELESQITSAYMTHHEMNKELSTVQTPMDKLVRETNQSVAEQKKQNVKSSLKDGVTFEYLNGMYVQHIHVEKINKKTAHVKFYRSGYFKDDAMRYNLEDLIGMISRQDFKIVDKSEIDKLRESRN
jgi:hypothetical protein